MLKVLINLIAMIICLIGAYAIFDARVITKKYFSFGDKNSAVLSLKIVGFIIFIIGLVIIKINI